MRFMMIMIPNISEEKALGRPTIAERTSSPRWASTTRS